MLWKKCLFSGERNNTGLFFRCFVQSFGCLSAGPVVWPEELFSFFRVSFDGNWFANRRFFRPDHNRKCRFILMEDETPAVSCLETVTQQLGKKRKFRYDFSHHQILVLIEIKHFFLIIVTSPVSIYLMCQNISSLCN